jgi:hypothetical protein
VAILGAGLPTVRHGIALKEHARIQEFGDIAVSAVQRTTTSRDQKPSPAEPC